MDAPDLSASFLFVIRRKRSLKNGLRNGGAPGANE